MTRRTLLARLQALLSAAVLTALLGSAAPARADELVVISHAPLRGVDGEALKRIFTGRMVELDGQSLRPINLPAGHPLRLRFLAAVMQQDDADYIAYWTVRRYIGKGAPPREAASAAEVLELVRSTPGAVGYIDGADLKPGVNVLLRR